MTELLRKAKAWQALLDSGQVINQAEIARREGVSRARVTQVLGLARLAPVIQESILRLPATAFRIAITEPALRPVARLECAIQQTAAFEGLLRVRRAARSDG